MTAGCSLVQITIQQKSDAWLAKNIGTTGTGSTLWTNHNAVLEGCRAIVLEGCRATEATVRRRSCCFSFGSQFLSCARKKSHKWRKMSNCANNFGLLKVKYFWRILKSFSVLNKWDREYHWTFCGKYIATCPTNSSHEGYSGTSRGDSAPKFKLVRIRGTSHSD